MAKLDLHLIECALHDITTVLQCQQCCDWYGCKESPPVGDNELRCGFTDEVLQIYHRTVEIDLDIEVIKQPEPPELRPCEPACCVAQQRGGG